MRQSRTPTTIVTRLNTEFTKATRSDEVIRRLDEIGETVGGGTPEEYRQFLFATSERLAKVIKDTGIELEE